MNNDTICALATPAGGAIAIIRISGKEMFPILLRIFKSQSVSYETIGQLPTRSLHYGNVVFPSNEQTSSQIIDEVLVSIFKNPHSYTGEDSAEISCHGSSYIIAKILEVLIANGCRMAEPGEFTQRAFLNGKMDLSQAEAVADLIASTNKATHQIALSQLRGNFSSELSKLRNQLLEMTSLLELELDFSDHEDLEFADRDTLLELAKRIDNRITSLAHSFETGNAIKQGIPVAIVGKTNVGKSTLLNRFLHEEKAIVSSIHGTTRDVIEDNIQIHGVTFRFIDTAGLRSTDNEIEKIGIERAYQKMHEATLILWVVDSLPNELDIREFKKQTESKTIIIVRNKIDLEEAPKEENISGDIDNTVYLQVSAKYNINIDRLEEVIYRAANIPAITQNDVIITSARHYHALLHAKDSIQRVIDGMQNNLSGDLLAEDLNLCIEQLGTITGGSITTEETLQNIFSRFCVGK